MKKIFVLMALAALATPAAASAAFMHFVCRSPDNSAMVEFKPLSNGTIEVSVIIGKENLNVKQSFKTASCTASTLDLRVVSCVSGAQNFSSVKLSRLSTVGRSSKLAFSGTMTGREPYSFNEANCGPVYPDPEQ
ncbi:MAG: hypothetical protein A2583_04495 [Bdellovibrionales bacterium RIFOXYD1_FULL_53_11]|nr:MAG: hypothetical protein A2583_04495 [Bdellovibrionales bacterium RIFOXYD1_FULL_53_11]